MLYFLLEISSIWVRLNVNSFEIAPIMEQLILGVKIVEKYVLERALKMFLEVCRKVLP